MTAKLPDRRETSSSQHLTVVDGTAPSSAVFWVMTPTWYPTLAHVWLGPFPSLIWFDYLEWSQEARDVCTCLAPWISLIMWVMSDGVAGIWIGILPFNCRKVSSCSRSVDGLRNCFSTSSLFVQVKGDFCPQMIMFLCSVSFCLLLCVKL